MEENTKQENVVQNSTTTGNTTQGSNTQNSGAQSGTAQGNVAQGTPIYVGSPASSTQNAQRTPGSIPVYPVETKGKSYFDGTTLQLIGWRFLGALVSLITFGLCMPLAYTMIYKWEATHTYIEGRRLKFDGSALQLFGKFIIWFLGGFGLSILFIIAEVIVIFAAGGFEDTFDSIQSGIMPPLALIVIYLIFILALFLYDAWVEVALRKWKASHTFFS